MSRPKFELGMPIPFSEYFNHYTSHVQWLRDVKLHLCMAGIYIVNKCGERYNHEETHANNSWNMTSPGFYASINLAQICLFILKNIFLLLFLILGFLKKHFDGGRDMQTPINRRRRRDKDAVKEIWKRKSALNCLPGNSRGKPHIGKEMVSAIIPLKRKPIHQAPTNFASPDFIPILEVKTKIESSLRHYLPFYLNKINFFK